MVQLLGNRYRNQIAFFLAYLLTLGYIGDLKAAVYGFHSRGDHSFVTSTVYAGGEISNDSEPSRMHNNSAGPVVAAAATKGAAGRPYGGPTQPEMQSFKSVNASNMVDLFTGDFSYNIPLMDVGGYPLSLHYNSGITMDQEASWVGCGWNVNPGAVTRTMRGLPDDFNGQDSITKIESIKENKTVSVAGDIDVELLGLNTAALKVSAGFTLGVTHNNYMGWGVETGICPSISTALSGGKNAAGTLTGSLSITSSSQYGANISPSIAYRLSSNNKSQVYGASIGSNYNNRAGMSALQLHAEAKQSVYALKNSNDDHIYSSAGVNASISFAVPSYMPTISMPFKNSTYSFGVKVGGEIWGVRPGFGITGTVQSQKLAYIQKSFPAYGYMNYTKGKNDAGALLDFNREKELCFNYSSTPHIAIPAYTYDAFSISGEGINGMFRAYRSDIGYIHDHKMQTESGSDKLSVDIGAGGYVHIGTDLMMVDASTENKAWLGQNDLLPKVDFTDSDTTYESVYVKNPGEQTAADQDFHKAIGGDDLVRARLTGDDKNVSLAPQLEKVISAQPAGYIDINTPIIKNKRDKRTQMTTCLTAEQADRYGYEKTIKSYPENSYPEANCPSGVTEIQRVSGYRKANHISEVDVLNTDGKKYVYSLPVYNVEQQEATMAVAQQTDAALLDRGLTRYDNTDDGVSNNKGKDNYYARTITPAYPHSFLLTAILSPDYVDLRGDGVTDDDLGDAIKFNYTQITTENNPFSWRVPYSTEHNLANYNEGFKSYSRDDKGTYIYGKKELWYTNSIASKNMIALFRISPREDVVSVADRSGGLNTAGGKMLRKLDRIDLYSKSDFIKNGVNAKPVKSVFFEYYPQNAALCKNISGPGTAKLTLKAVWFSYNGGRKRNPYIFNYNANNPDYNPARYDRWGNYKDPANNPGGLGNLDYPYAVQDSAIAAKNVAAWNLEEIRLPSGGKLKVTYEGDDYAYVQNKRAAQLFKIAGFAASESAAPSGALYSQTAENRYVFVDLPTAVENAGEFNTRYLQGISQLYFKLSVKMPVTDKWRTGNDYEWIPLYADIESIGLVNKNRAWIKVKEVNGGSPFAKVAIQFLRLNLPSKAYPNSETGDDVGFTEMVQVVFSSLKQYVDIFKKFETIAKGQSWCKDADLNHSFIRLDQPDFKRYGGGLRVKRVELSDSYNKMTGERESTYGKEYNYTTTGDVNGKQVTISSGVASYEPGIGADENPFRVAKELNEKTNLMAPANLMYSEEPLGECFFPAPVVGYSKVRVRTINADKTKSADGWEETEFYTSRDFPTLTDFTPLDVYSKKRYKPQLNSFFRVNAKDYVTLSQGFKVELNDMHGKMKSQASYPENDGANPVTSTKYYYRVDDDKAAQKHLNNDVLMVQGAAGTLTGGVMGKEIELMTDFREQVSKTTSLNVGINADIVPAFFIPLVLPSAIPFPQSEEMRFRSSAVVKTINRHAILDSVVSVDKGSVVSTKNLVWDGESGEVIVSRTNNEFNDPVYNFTYPAWWAYDGMGPAYTNLGATFDNKNLQIVRGKLFGSDNVPSYFEKYFRSGDEMVVDAYLEAGVTNITPVFRSAAVIVNDPNLCGPVNWDNNLSRTRIWALDAAKGKEQHSGIYFIDQEGRPFTGKIVTMKIVRSGRRNMSGAGAGSIVSLANPVRTINGQRRIVIDNDTRVLSASTATFNDFWKVANHWYVKDTVYKVPRYFQPLTLEPSVTLFRSDRVGPNSPIASTPRYNNDYVIGSMDYIDSQSGSWGCWYGRASRQQLSKSVLSFNFSLIPSNAIITNATISFVPYNTVRDLFARVTQGGRRCRESNYDWANNNTYFQSPSAAYLRRVTSPWGIGNGYNVPVTDANRVSNVNNYNYQNISCTNLVQDIIRGGNYGILFEEQRTDPPNNDHQWTNFLSFNAKNSFNGKIHAAPQLTVTYKIIVDSVGQLCKQFISDSMINPYRFGILGAWRGNKQYVYYHDRNESVASATTQTDTRNEGVLKDFVPFWSFTPNGLQMTADTSKWLWTSVQQYFNKKGFETENYDALYRYNSGSYGYNQQLALTAVQNARQHETFFDGFEDYNYATKACTDLCKDKRVFDGFTITNADSHTGTYSLSLPANNIRNVDFAVSGAADTLQTLSIKIDSTRNYQEIVTPRGKGLTGTYSGCGRTINRIDPVVNFYWPQKVSPDPTLNCTTGWQTIVWRGKLQATNTDFYRFYIDFRGGRSTSYIMTVGNRLVTFNGGFSIPMRLVAGQLYDVIISFKTERSHHFGFPQFGNDYYDLGITASWSRNNAPTKVLIPAGSFYPNTYPVDSAGSYKKNLVSYCVKMNNVKPANVILPGTAPIKGGKYVVSGWVKVKGDNNNNAVIGNKLPLGVGFGSRGNAAVWLVATGVRIEGWQRYDAVVDVPAGATLFRLFLQSGNNELLFDDLRIHPFNANMKSYVYDPVSLRLVADLDENNYATYYEYDDEGTLIRVKKETEEGVKTLKETRSSQTKISQ